MAHSCLRSPFEIPSYPKWGTRVKIPSDNFLDKLVLIAFVGNDKLVREVFGQEFYYILFLWIIRN